VGVWGAGIGKCRGSDGRGGVEGLSWYAQVCGGIGRLRSSPLGARFRVGTSRPSRIALETGDGLEQLTRFGGYATEKCCIGPPGIGEGKSSIERQDEVFLLLCFDCAFSGHGVSSGKGGGNEKKVGFTMQIIATRPLQGFLTYYISG